MRTDVLLFKNYLSFSSVQSLSHVQLFATPWIAAHQASLSITNSQSSPKLMSIESVIPSLDFVIFKKGILAYEWLTFTFTFACDWNLNFVKGMKSSRTHPHPLFKDDNSFEFKLCKRYEIKQNSSSSSLQRWQLFFWKTVRMCVCNKWNYTMLNLAF